MPWSHAIAVHVIVGVVGVAAHLFPLPPPATQIKSDLSTCYQNDGPALLQRALYARLPIGEAVLRTAVFVI